MSLALLLITVTALAQDATRTKLDESNERNWTPNTDAAWGNPEWRRFGDAKIRDDRFMATDYGPVVGATIDIQGDGRNTRAHKGLAVRLGGRDNMPKAMLVYDRNLLQCAGGWIGGWLNHSDERFGLMDVPTNAAEAAFVAAPEQAWFRPGEEPADRGSWCFPLPIDVGVYRGLHLQGDDTVLEYDFDGTRVLEHPTLEQLEGEWRLVRHFEVAPDEEALILRLGAPGNAVAVAGNVDVRGVGQTRAVHIPPNTSPRLFKIVHDVTAGADIGQPRSLAPMLTGNRPLRWPDTITTAVEHVGEAGPYVHERIVPPFENPWKSLMFLGGLDFMPNGDPIVSTLFGDVWIVSGIDAGTPTWKRFATGLYQPLGIRVIDGDIFVIERGQLTQLIDHDADGEADEYRNINNRWHTPGDAHCYDINLETDPDGNWYFVKNGAWHTPTGGCILKINADGSGDAQVWATGFRHCNSLGISPTGQLASGGQQGNWQPATRLDLNRNGGFYGLMDASHNEGIEFYDRPLLWMPLACDNSAGDPVFAPDAWGPLGGELLHLSWGQCWVLHILQDRVEGISQGGAVVLPLGRCMAGPARGRFSPVDGDLYIAGCMGWQTWGPWDGSLECIRFTGTNEALPTPTAMTTGDSAIKLRFDVLVDPASAADASNFDVRQWNYHWSEDYGSAHWRTTMHMVEGEDTVDTSASRLNGDHRTVELSLPTLRPAMQTRIGYDLRTLDGSPIQGVVYATAHRAPQGLSPIKRDRVLNTILHNMRIDLAWTGDAQDAALMLRAVPNDEGDMFGLNIPLAADGDGDHELRITALDRHIIALLDGKVIVDHFETDTRVPLAGRLVLEGDWPATLKRFDVRPINSPPED